MHVCQGPQRLASERQVALRLHRQQQRRTSSLVRAQKQAEANKEGFMWDPSNARWKRVSAEKNEKSGGKFGSDKWMEGGGAVIKAKSGGEYTVWPMIHQSLQQRGLKSVSTEEAHRLQESGKGVLVDVRARWNYDKEHIDGAVSMPLFRGVEGKSAWDTAKRLVMTIGFAMKATERDPDFRQKAKEQLDARKTLIVYCSLGGTLTVGAKPWAPGRKSFPGDPERAFGRESRSLKGAYELLEAGFKNVIHLEGGMPQWRRDGYPTTK